VVRATAIANYASPRQSRKRKEPVVKQVTYVGFDAQSETAMLMGTHAAACDVEVPNEPKAVRRLVWKLERDAPSALRACRDAGPSGVRLVR
jgi:hypothetical protein